MKKIKSNNKLYELKESFTIFSKFDKTKVLSLRSLANEKLQEYKKFLINWHKNNYYNFYDWDIKVFNLKDKFFIVDKCKIKFKYKSTNSRRIYHTEKLVLILSSDKSLSWIKESEFDQMFQEI